ncbi:DUF2628 domain-containing protein [Shewanella yunxiaonensis]|uniref:DUF2628 domain-containing protein n=2 Tax=Shewanella TaxID=22 RepID=A0ABX7YUD4_9GAMM|nr:DUF2628 domain-containing protein [Shewanella yunxiaonensis]QUN06369.1 DUF2628 domain-containing protein [Shewanella yunxiaonensis]
MGTFNIIFKGEVIEGKEPQKLAIALARYLKLPEDKAYLLLSGKELCIKKHLNASEASAIHAKLLSVGIITYLKEAAPPETKPAAKPSAPERVQQAKPATGTRNQSLKTPHILPSDNSKPRTAHQDYSSLSKGWQMIFNCFDELGVDKVGYRQAIRSDALRQRSLMERRKLRFNFLGALFGPLYYFAKGMFKKGLYLTLALAIVNIAIGMIWALFSDSAFIDRLIVAINTVTFAMQVNYDYYRYYRFKETLWPWLPKWMDKWWGVLSVYILALVAFFGLAFLINLSDESDTASTIKDSYLEGYEQTSIGQAFDNWSPCATIKWESHEAKNGTRTVTYHCQMKLNTFKQQEGKVYRLVTHNDDTKMVDLTKQAILQMSFTVNYDDSFIINDAQWDIDLGDHHYQPYVPHDSVLYDIYKDELYLSIAEIFSPKNILSNEFIRDIEQAK